MNKHPLIGRKQTEEHKKRRVESLIKNGKLRGRPTWNKGMIGKFVKDLTGKRFGRLVVLEYAGMYLSDKGHGRQSLWKCQCDCGNIKVVQRSALVCGVTVSCGCFNNENAQKLGLSNIGEKNGMYGKMSGTQNPNWKGGITDGRNKKAQSREYIQWRRSVYHRDDYTCQVCGEKGCELQAHHILPFSAFPEYRHEVENGLTLCLDCHKYAKVPITNLIAAA